MADEMREIAARKEGAYSWVRDGLSTATTTQIATNISRIVKPKKEGFETNLKAPSRSASN